MFHHSAEWHSHKPINPTAHISKTELGGSNFTVSGRCVQAEQEVFNGKMHDFQ